MSERGPRIALSSATSLARRRRRLSGDSACRNARCLSTACNDKAERPLGAMARSRADNRVDFPHVLIYRRTGQRPRYLLSGGSGVRIPRGAPTTGQLEMASLSSAIEARVSARRAGRDSIGECPPGSSMLSIPKRRCATHFDHEGLTARSSSQWTEATGTSGQRSIGRRPSHSAVCCRRRRAKADSARSKEQS